MITHSPSSKKGTWAIPRIMKQKLGVKALACDANRPICHKIIPNLAKVFGVWPGEYMALPSMPIIKLSQAEHPRPQRTDAGSAWRAPRPGGLQDPAGATRSAGSAVCAAYRQGVPSIAVFGPWWTLGSGQEHAGSPFISTRTDLTRSGFFNWSWVQRPRAAAPVRTSEQVPGPREETRTEPSLSRHGGT